MEKLFFNEHKQGVNLGGWLSQLYADHDGHFESFILREDIEQIAQWGADHVRLPVDYDIIEREDTGELSEKGVRYIDKCLEWCKLSNLNLILDLHKAPGQVYGDMDTPIPLFTDETCRKRFLKIWENLAKRYVPIGDGLTFELLNEISDSTGYCWNNLCSEAVSAIHTIDPDRTVLIGSNNANSVLTLKELAIQPDDNIVYTFHYYDPLPFTHQKAHFSKDMRDFNCEVHYPGTIEGFPEYIGRHPEYVTKFRDTVWEKDNNKDFIERYLNKAQEFIKYTGKQLYCGEFGVIYGTPDPSAMSWLHDVIALLESYGIGHAYWAYKEMDFGLVSFDGQIIRPHFLGELFPCKKV
jgi:aryl-phospho-beta-D-glucosidase BglC (GH1 family)